MKFLDLHLSDREISQVQTLLGFRQTVRIKALDMALTLSGLGVHCPHQVQQSSWIYTNKSVFERASCSFNLLIGNYQTGYKLGTTGRLRQKHTHGGFAQPTGQSETFNLQSLLPLDSEALHHVHKTTATSRTDSGQAGDTQKCYESKSSS